jgi:hypothetical protein
MAIILFAIIGASINAGAWYWICFALYCAFTLYKAIKETLEERW